MHHLTQPVVLARIDPLPKFFVEKAILFRLEIGSLRSECGLRSAKIPCGGVAPGAPVRSVTEPAALCRHLRSALRAAFRAGYVASSILVRVLPQEISTRSFRQIFLAKGLVEAGALAACRTYPAPLRKTAIRPKFSLVFVICVHTNSSYS